METYLKILDFPKKRDKTSRLLGNTQQQVSFHIYIDRLCNDVYKINNREISKKTNSTFPQDCSVVWGCRIHRLLLCRGVKPYANVYPRYDTKQSDGEAPVMLELWGMRSTPLLPSLLGPLKTGVAVPDRA